MRTKLFTLGVFALAWPSSAASAQTYAMDRGVWVAGGSASLSHYQESGSGASITSVVLSPTIGYFFVPGLVVAINPLYGHSSGSSQSSTRYGAGPRLAYYFGNGSVKLHPYVAAGAFFGQNNWELSGSSAVTNSQSFSSWYGSAGVALLLVRNVAVTGDLHYGQTHYGDADVLGGPTGTITDYGTTFGISLFLY